MPSSLFGSDTDDEDEGISVTKERKVSDDCIVSLPIPAYSSAPSIPGLYLLPSLVPLGVQFELSSLISSDSIFAGPDSTQAMFFSSPAAKRDPGKEFGSRSGLPRCLNPLLDILPKLLRSSDIPSHVYKLICESRRPQQAILNLYRVGQQGISAHVDIPDRYEDGILGVSLLGSTVMIFTLVEPEGVPKVQYHMLLRPGDVYILSGQARYLWKHEIENKENDVILSESGAWTTLRRRTRISITLRRMREGADIVGGCSS